MTLLFEKGADVHLKDTKYSQTSLSWAARKGNDGVVKLLEHYAQPIPHRRDFGR